MAITQTVCTSFKKELLEGVHNFTSHTFKIALYTSTANLDADTTAYTTSNEVSGSGGYSAGGATLAISPFANTVSTGIDDDGVNVAYLTFSNVIWSADTFTARGALIYNSSQSNKAVMALDFGGDKVADNSSFQVTFPPSSATSALIRIT